MAELLSNQTVCEGAALQRERRVSVIPHTSHHSPTAAISICRVSGRLMQEKRDCSTKFMVRDLVFTVLLFLLHNIF